MTSRARHVVACVAVACLSGSLTACGAAQAIQAGASEGNCASALIFEGRRYVWLLTQDEHFKPGTELGTGTYEPCFDGDETDLGPSTEPVFILHDVPSEEAIVLTDANGRHGIIYRADHEPEGGWDRDLRSWLERAGVKTG